MPTFVLLCSKDAASTKLLRVHSHYTLQVGYRQTNGNPEDVCRMPPHLRCLDVCFEVLVSNVVLQALHRNWNLRGADVFLTNTLPIRAPSFPTKGRNSGGLKSLETLERSNIEDKFDLYKKRAKNALSPDKRGAGSGVERGKGAGRSASASGSSSRRESSAASSSSRLAR